MTVLEARKAWIKVYHAAEKVDPEQERDWEDLAYGFFLGCGLTPKRAQDLELQMLQEGLL